MLGNVLAAGYKYSEIKYRDGCVIHAYAKAFGISQEAVLKRFGVKKGQKLAGHAYQKLTDKQAIKKFSDLGYGIDITNDAYGFTVGEVADYWSDEIVLMSVPGHSVVSMYGKVCNAWDSRKQRVYEASIVRRH